MRHGVIDKDGTLNLLCVNGILKVSQCPYQQKACDERCTQFGSVDRGYNGHVLNVCSGRKIYILKDEREK
jgi:hypothetical protein